MSNFYVSIASMANYVVSAETSEEAIKKGLEWFAERKPALHCEVLPEPNEDYKKIFKGTYSNEKYIGMR